MNNLLLAILTGFLVRADGWGTSNPKLKPFAEFFSVFTCAPLFGIMVFLETCDWAAFQTVNDWYKFLLTGDLLVSGAAALAFLIWRLPGFRNGGLPNFILRRLPYRFKIKWLAPENGWEHWRNMFIRGLWTSAIGFAAISYVAHGHIEGAILSVPFSAVYMVIYSGGYRWLPEKFLGLKRHVWIEHASGWAFALFAMGML